VRQAIDLRHLGRDRVICAYEIDGVVVDPGPASCLEMLAELRPHALLLTHIHLDHAGATGALVRRNPQLKVYVHELGAAHLVDPTRLLASARRLYGSEMEELWGEVAAVPERNIVALTGGEVVEGFRVAYTPGHASHHVSYLDQSTGDAYTGDSAGIRIPPSSLIMAPTPPPDVDLDGWQRSIEEIAAWRPTALCLTHFGCVTDVEDHLLQLRARIAELGRSSRDGRRDDFRAAVEAQIASGADAATGERYRSAGSPEQMWLGLERYWRKRRESGQLTVS